VSSKPNHSQALRILFKKLKEIHHLHLVNNLPKPLFPCFMKAVPRHEKDVNEWSVVSEFATIFPAK